MPAPLLSSTRAHLPVIAGVWSSRIAATGCGLSLLLVLNATPAIGGVHTGLLIASVLAVWIEAPVGAVLAWASAGAVYPVEPWWAGIFAAYALVVTVVAGRRERAVRRAVRAFTVGVVPEAPAAPPSVPFARPRLALFAAVALIAAVVRWHYGWPWQALFAGVALALGVRAVLDDRRRRRLLAGAQPTFAVRARIGRDRVAVYALDAADGDPAFVTIALVEPAEMSALPSLLAVDDIPEQPAVLLGAPVPGGWCTLRVGTQTRVPARTAEESGAARPAGQELEPDLEPEPEPEPVPAGSLDRQVEILGQGYRLWIAGALLALVAWWVLPSAGWSAAYAVVGLALLEGLWLINRPATLAWDGYGVSIRGPRAVRTWRWIDISEIVRTPDGFLWFGGDEVCGLLPARSRTRSNDELLGALRGTHRAAVSADVVGPHVEGARPERSWVPSAVFLAGLAAVTAAQLIR